MVSAVYAYHPHSRLGSLPARREGRVTTETILLQREHRRQSARFGFVALIDGANSLVPPTAVWSS